MTKWREGMPTKTFPIFDINKQEINGYVLNVEAVGEIHRIIIEQEDIDDVFDSGLEALAERRQIDFWKYKGIQKLLEEGGIKIKFTKKENMEDAE